ncbi:MGMT family protein [Streptomyces sp. TP-A0874]|uniref:MGMT family protein n=1 Tax=Streptomyces sp. TP-A0874 TaxID=549819 RepID=UPI000B2B2B1B|nr:MGMT family protein [Streptomyces sp. TP-A0874]
MTGWTGAGGAGGTGGPDRAADARTAAAPEEVPPRYPEYADRVLEVAELIPAGKVLTYGDIAEWLGEGGPRQVGRVMARYGGAVPWWRVVRADGVPLVGSERRALARYRAEGTPLRAAGPAARGSTPRIDMARARWDGGPAEARSADGDGHEGGHN